MRPHLMFVLAANLLASGASAQSSEGQVATVGQAEAGPIERERFEGEVQETLRLLRDPDHPDTSELLPGFTEAGRRVPGLLYRILVDRRVPAWGEEKAQGLSVFQRDLILAGFEGMGRAFVMESLCGALAAAESRSSRQAAVEVLGAVGNAGDVDRLFELALTEEEEGPGREMEEAFRRAAGSILARDDEAFVGLSRNWRTKRGELLPALVMAVGQSGNPAGLGFLADVILWDDELALPAIAQISRLGRGSDERLNHELSIRLRQFLDAERPEHCRASCLALAELEDMDAIPFLIDLLELEEAPGLAKNGLFALRKLTGLSLPLDARRWKHWYEGELDWMRSEKAREFRRLLSHEASQAAKGLRAIEQHPLAKEELVVTLRAVLIDRDEDVRVLACQALAEHGDEYVIPWLVDALWDPYPEVQDAAWKALRKISGLELTAVEWAVRAMGDEN